MATNNQKMLKLYSKRIMYFIQLDFEKYVFAYRIIGGDNLFPYDGEKLIPINKEKINLHCNFDL